MEYDAFEKGWKADCLMCSRSFYQEPEMAEKIKARRRGWRPPLLSELDKPLKL